MEFPANPARPILLIDKSNFLASILVERFADNATIVVLSQEKIESEKDVVYVPYLPPLPQIPDGMYKAIVFVWSEKESHLLDPLLTKAKELHVPLFLITTEEEKEFLPNEHSGVIVLVVGDLFDIQGKFPLTTFLREAKAKKRIQLANMGLQSWYPIFLQDAIAKISELVTKIGEHHSQYFIGPMHMYTSLTIAHALQKVDPDITIDFVPGGDDHARARHETPAFTSYDSSKRLQEVYHDMSTRIVGKSKEIAQVVFAKQKKKKKGKWGWYVLYLLLVILFLPLCVALVSGGIGAYLLTASVQDVKSASFSQALIKVRAAEQNFSLSTASMNVVGQEVGLIGQSHLVDGVNRKIVLGQTVAQILEKGIGAIQSFASITSGKSVSTESDAQSLVASLHEEELSLQEVNTQDLPKQYQDLFTNIAQLTAIFSGTENTLPQILGVGQDKTYLVLFQNNMELRPGGGFIGSYGLLTLSNGAVKSFTIHNVYDADGQLKGHIEPPFAIRRYIPLVHLYLRDSNFDPDFTLDGKDAAVILSQETGERVDGVIGVDLQVLQALLASVGSVYVPSYSQTIHEKNFFSIIEQHVDRNSFPGSTQKQDFLQALTSALVAKLQAKNGIDVSMLLAKAAGILEGKHIMISFANPALESPFSLAGLSGSLSDTRASSSGVMNDYLGVVEANLGVNKVNAFVTRSLSQSVAIDASGNAVETAMLTINNSSDGTWPGGAYKNYLRFILPENARVQAISLNTVDQHMVPAVTNPQIYEAKSFVAPKGLEVDKEIEAGKSLYGFLITVATESSLSIQISYAIPNAFSLSGQKLTYNQLVFKQSGVESYPYQLTFTVPNQYAMLGSKNSSTATELQGTIDKDSMYSISFGQQ